MMKRVCIVTDDYPMEGRPYYTFIEELAVHLSMLGVEVTVLCPSSYTAKWIRKKPLKPKKYIRKNITIYSPRYISFSTKKVGFNTSKWTLKAFMSVCDNFLSAHHEEFDTIYGHFIFPSGIVASQLGHKYSLKSYLAYGENTLYTIEYLGEEKTRKLLEYLSGVIAVSSDNKRILEEHTIVDSSLIDVFPNSIDSKTFYPRGRDLRKKYGLSEDDFLVAFVGYFIPIKGPNRLSRALKILNKSDLYALFLGKGPITPDYEKTIYEGLIEHEDMPKFLSMADVFVLPTIAEGCCNAIVEALACGLPVISSNQSFNDDILDETCSIRVDPENIDEIATAIEHLYNDEDLRERLSKGALEKAKSLDIEARAKRILDFMNRGEYEQ